MNELFPGIRLHHISMNVCNYDECLKFYLGMGLRVFCEWIWEEDGFGYKKGGKNVFLDVGNGTCVELHEVDVQNLPKGLVEHFCFYMEKSEDVDAAYKRAIELGAKSLYEPFDQKLMCSPKPIEHSRVAHVTGPAGEQIEIISWNGYNPYE